MITKKARQQVVDKIKEEAIAVPQILSQGLQITSMIEVVQKDPSKFSDSMLAPIFSSVHTLHARMGKFLDSVKTELKLRRESWSKSGDQGQHRLLHCDTQYGPVEIECQTRDTFKLNEERAVKALAAKGLRDDVFDLVIDSGSEELQKFLKKHKKEVQAMGLRLREVFNEDKLAALVKEKKITADEFKAMIDQGSPSYAITVKTPLDLGRVLAAGENVHVGK
jgi:hypothetical protein